MATVDYHAGCGSYVRISAEDLSGPHGAVLDEFDHPATLKYPDTRVAICSLVAGHDGRCEMFVDGNGPGHEPYEGYWVTWEW